jgi:hypothetical protein
VLLDVFLGIAYLGAIPQRTMIATARTQVTELDSLPVALGGEEEVFDFDIAMGEAVGVEVGEGGGGRSENVENVAFSEGLLATDRIVEEGVDGFGAVFHEQVVEREPTAAAAAAAAAAVVGAARWLLVVGPGANVGDDVWVQRQAGVLLQLHFRGMVQRHVALGSAQDFDGELSAGFVLG